MTTTRVVIAGGDDVVVARIRELLGDRENFALIHVSELDAALQELAGPAPQVCLVIHELDGFRGIELIGRAIGAGCEAPLILLRHGGDADTDRQALATGATDSLVYADLTAPILERAIRHGSARRLAEGQRIALVREQLARQKAEALNRAKDEFLSTLSHDLRTPLNAMLGWAQLLRDGQLDEKARDRAISAILRSGRAQASLIEGLLDVTPLQLLAPPANGGPTLEGIRVLIVEDDDESRDYLRITLELNGATVTATDSAAKAWHELANAVFDVMLSDIVMPVEDGLSLARRLRLSDDAVIRRLPAAALSAHAGAADRERALTAGFQVHLAKPIEPRELLAAVAGLTATGT